MLPLTLWSSPDFSVSASICFPQLQRVGNRSQGAFHCALVLHDNSIGLLSQFKSQSRILQNPAGPISQVLNRIYLKPASTRSKRTGDLYKIIDVRAEQHRFLPRSRLQEIVPAEGDEASSHESRDPDPVERR